MYQEQCRQTNFDLEDLINLFNARVYVMGRGPWFWLDEIVAEADDGNIKALRFLEGVLEANLVEKEMLDYIDSFFFLLSQDSVTLPQCEGNLFKKVNVTKIRNYLQESNQIQCRYFRRVLACKK